MIKAQFLSELERRLDALPRAEIDRALQFYSEMIDDRKEEGLTEPEAVADLGSLDDIAGEVLAGAASGQPVEYQRKKANNHVVLLILGSPLWFVMIVLGICVWFVLILLLWILVLAGWIVSLALDVSVGAVLFSALVAVWAVAIGLLVGGAGCCVATPFLMTRGLLTALFNSGMGLFALGLGALMLPLLLPTARGLWKAGKVAIPPINRIMERLMSGAWKLCRRSLVGFKHRFIDREVG